VACDRGTPTCLCGERKTKDDEAIRKGGFGTGNPERQTFVDFAK